MSDSPVEWDYLDLADYLLIAEAVLGVDAAALVRVADVGLAESALVAPGASFGEVEFYPDFATKAAVLCRRLAKNHPLPDGNKRAAFLSTVEFVERNGFAWEPPPGADAGVAETVKTIEAVAAGTSKKKNSPNGSVREFVRRTRGAGASYFCGSGGGLTSMPRASSASGDQPASSP